MNKEKYLVETIRSMGVGLIVAGITVLSSVQMSTLNGLTVLIYGCIFVILGLVLIDNDTD